MALKCLVIQIGYNHRHNNDLRCIAKTFPTAS
jgi:hypothetical protein